MIVTYDEKLGAKVLVFLNKLLPNTSNYDQIKRECAREQRREDQWRLLMDSLEKKGLVTGDFTRNVWLTKVGKSWVHQQGIEELSKLEELAERRFQRTARTLYEPLFPVVRDLVEQFTLQGLARSSSFCQAVADLVFKQFSTLKTTFIESYIGTLQETPQGVTPYREAWLNEKLEGIWEEQLLRARGQASTLAQSTGFSAADVSRYADRVETRDRDLKTDVINEIRIAALAPPHPKSHGLGESLMIHITGDGNVIGDNNRVVTTINKTLAENKSVELANAFALLRGEVLQLDGITDKVRRTAVRAIEDAEDEVLENKPNAQKVQNALERVKDTLEESGQVFDAAQGWGYRLMAIGSVIMRVLPTAWDWLSRLPK